MELLSMSELWLREDSMGVPVRDVMQVQLTEIVQLVWTVLYRRLVTSLTGEGRIKDDGISEDM